MKCSDLNKPRIAKYRSVRTLEDWEAARRTPPEYIPRLIAYQLKYEELRRNRYVMFAQTYDIEAMIYGTTNRMPS